MRIWPVVMTMTLIPATLSAAPVSIVTGPYGSYRADVVTLKEKAFRNTVRQQYDFSCGSAALATLLTYHYEFPVDETIVFKGMFLHGNQQSILRTGFSMRDMKAYAESEGFEANGYRIPLDTLAKLGVPAIVVLNLKGFMHFVVVKGIKDDWVLVGDPAIGIRSYSRAEFGQLWGGTAFLIVNKKSTGQKNYNHSGEWASVTKAPLATGVFNPDLANFSRNLPGPNDFRF